MGLLIVLFSFLFIVDPLIAFAGTWAEYTPNSWQLRIFRAIGFVVLTHFFWHPYLSAVPFIADILLISLLAFVIEKLFPSLPPTPPTTPTPPK